VFCHPTFAGVDNFCTNAHGIRWMIGAIFVECRPAACPVSTACPPRMHKILATRHCIGYQWEVKIPVEEHKLHNT